MSTEKKIIPRKLSGFMELPPAKQIIFNRMKDGISKVFEQYCFVPIDTPVLELGEILLAKSGGEIDKEIYHFKKGDTEIAMRYDLTVPLARFVAMNAENLSYPFKRYQIGKVYRGEKAQKGRFREFYQCDADIIGNGQLPIAADAECINLIYCTFKKLKLEDVVIHISNRNILVGYMQELNIKNPSEALTLLDKLGKMGKNKTLEELKLIGLSEDTANKLITLAITKDTFDSVLSKIENLSQNETYQKGVSELKAVGNYVKAYGVPEVNYCLDLGIIRGQNYYTGTVFEAYLTSHPEFGAVSAGGRYDNLAEYFTDKKLPGVGMSIGLTRLFDLLDTHNMLGEIKQSPVEVEVIPLGDTLEECFSLARSIKEMSAKCEVNYDERSFKAKLKDAGKREIPYVVIIGEEEVKTKQYVLKNMKEGTQETLPLEKIAIKIRKQKLSYRLENINNSSSNS